MKWYRKNLKVDILVLLVFTLTDIFKVIAKYRQEIISKIAKNCYLLPGGDPQSCN